MLCYNVFVNQLEVIPINIKLFKNNEIILDKNVDFKKEFDKILFEIDEMKCLIEIKDNKLLCQRENEDYKFNLSIGDNNKCDIYLKKEDALFDIEVDDATFYKEDNKIIIYYMIESLDEANKVEITLER